MKSSFIQPLTYQALNVKAEVFAPKVRVCSIPVKHNLGHTLIYQLVVLRPTVKREREKNGQREKLRDIKKS